jgi:UDP-N-acetyl-D-mannosaminuronic acid dehydrogenase
VLSTDPFVTTDPELLPLEEVIARSDVFVVATPHAAYASVDLGGKPALDVWNILPRQTADPLHRAR